MDKIADYELIRSLGPGGRGDYYLARTPKRLPVNEEHVAVKVITDAREGAFQRASRELNAFASVQSPYLASLYDAGQHDGAFYYATEYLPGGSLRDQQVPVRERSAFTTLAHAARAAQTLHDAGMVHRDIGPGNVLLTEDGGKLSDLDLTVKVAPGNDAAGMPAITSVEFTDPALLGEGEPARRAMSGRSAPPCTGWLPAPACTVHCPPATRCARCARCSRARRRWPPASRRSPRNRSPTYQRARRGRS